VTSDYIEDILARPSFKIGSFRNQTWPTLDNLYRVTPCVKVENVNCVFAVRSVKHNPWWEDYLH